MGKEIVVTNLDEMCDLMCDNIIPKDEMTLKEFMDYLIARPNTDERETYEQIRNLMVPVHFVRGNADKDWAEMIPKDIELELAGKRFTCFDGFEEALIAQGAVYTPESAVTDGRMITGRGAGCAVAFGLAILSYLKGP